MITDKKEIDKRLEQIILDHCKTSYKLLDMCKAKIKKELINPLLTEIEIMKAMKEVNHIRTHEG